MIAGSEKKKLNKMRQNCWQPIETLWRMQQNMCCVQDNDEIISDQRAYLNTEFY